MPDKNEVLIMSFLLVIQKLGFCLTLDQKFYFWSIFTVIKVVLKNTKKVFTFFFVSKSFKVISLFSYQGSLSFPVARDSFYILSKLFAFVKNFFIYFLLFVDLFDSQSHATACS